VPERRDTADNATLARSLYEAYNERNFDLFEEMSAPDGRVSVVGTGDTFTGPEGARKYSEAWADGFPDSQVTIDHLTTSGNTVVVEFSGRGTHTGTLRTSMGDIPATGRTITLQLCDLLEFGDDGKIHEQRTYFDTGSLMAQLGITSPQAAVSK
jgi:steroid delta-isomerase-like uncharacterized protein